MGFVSYMEDNEDRFDGQGMGEYVSPNPQKIQLGETRQQSKSPKNKVNTAAKNLNQGGYCRKRKKKRRYCPVCRVKINTARFGIHLQKAHPLEVQNAIAETRKKYNYPFGEEEI